MKISKNKLYIFLTFAFIGLNIGFIGYYFYQKPVKNFADSTADISIQAKDLFDAFIKNEQKAIIEYVSSNKIIKVSGKIRDIIVNSDSTSIISLEVASAEGAISCNIEKNYRNKVKKLKPGNIVMIQGQCTGYQELINKEVIMMRCGIKD